jgi:hypothetical protein
MCNAHNHSYDCTCGFGGDTGGGSGGYGRYLATRSFRPASAGWAKDKGGTVDSYVNPNAHCPVCGDPVYFYRSPYDGRVFFDDLGWPWPKHGCTDNLREPRRTTRNSVSDYSSIPRSKWGAEGWAPLLASKVYLTRRPIIITGDFNNEFLELQVSALEIVDADSPIFLRVLSDMADLFELTFLRSDVAGTQGRKIVARCSSRIPFRNFA